MSKAHLKGVVVTAVGVMLAGFIMHQFRDVSAVAQSRAGFN